jgi:PAS domain-containing protein
LYRKSGQLGTLSPLVNDAPVGIFFARVANFLGSDFPLSRKTQNMLNDRRSPKLGYSCAVATVALATALRLLLDPLLGSGYPFATLFIAILATAWFGGFGAALAAVVLGGFAADYFLLAPRGSFSLGGPDEWTGLAVYALTGLGIAIVGGSMRAAQRRAEVSAQAAQSKAALIDQTYDALLVWDLRGTITFWNSGAERLYGIPREEALGRASHQLLRTTTDGGVAGFVSALERDGLWEGELQHSPQDHRTISVDSRMVLLGGLPHGPHSRRGTRLRHRGQS